VSDKAERRTARAEVSAYHERQLTALVVRAGEAIDRHRAGELDACEVDLTLFQYSRAAKELWKFCNLMPVEVEARMVRTEPPADWWERGAPRRD
jgi:hypothetical protein